MLQFWDIACGESLATVLAAGGRVSGVVISANHRPDQENSAKPLALFAGYASGRVRTRHRNGAKLWRGVGDVENRPFAMGAGPRHPRSSERAGGGIHDLVPRNEEVSHNAFVGHAAKMDIPLQTGYMEDRIVARHAEENHVKQFTAFTMPRFSAAIKNRSK